MDMKHSFEVDNVSGLGNPASDCKNCEFYDGLIKRLELLDEKWLDFFGFFPGEEDKAVSTEVSGGTQNQNPNPSQKDDEEESDNSENDDAESPDGEGKAGHGQLSKPDDFKCPKCDFAFNHLKLLKLHFKNVHPPQQIYGCQLCKIIYLNKHQQKKHRFEVHLSSFGCEFCKRKLKSKKSLSKHVRDSHGLGTTTCFMCRTDCQSYIKLVDHFKEHESETGRNILLRCDGCPKVRYFLSPYDKTQHQSIAHR